MPAEQSWVHFRPGARPRPVLRWMSATLADLMAPGPSWPPKGSPRPGGGQCLVLEAASEQQALGHSGAIEIVCPARPWISQSEAGHRQPVARVIPHPKSPMKAWRAVRGVTG